MKNQSKIMGNDWTALYFGIYGILVQVISFAVIYLLSNSIESDAVGSTTTTLIYVWYLLPILALVPLTIAIVQIRQRKVEGRAIKVPIAGMLVNIVWIIAVAVFYGAGISI
jgi:glucan phosphoethanolaminetransferase (alkaline phosphatase superfamily)